MADVAKNLISRRVPTFGIESGLFRSLDLGDATVMDHQMDHAVAQ